MIKIHRRIEKDSWLELKLLNRRRTSTSAQICFWSVSLLIMDSLIVSGYSTERLSCSLRRRSRRPHGRTSFNLALSSQQ